MTAIEVHLRQLEDTRTPNKPCFYEAVATIDGVTYSARSRSGASNELARVLVAAGLPDAPMAVRQQGFRGALTWRSFHRAALWTYEETASIPLHRVPYARLVAARERLRRGGVSAPEPGVIDPGVSVDAPAPVLAQNPAATTTTTHIEEAAE